MRAPACGRCGTTALPVAYGLPGDDLMAAAERGEVAIGGCVLGPGFPDWLCPSCGHGWQEEEEEPQTFGSPT